MLAANFDFYKSIYIHVLYSYKVWRKLKDTFDIPSHPSHQIHVLYSHKVWRKLKDTFDIPSHLSNPSHPSVPSNKTFSSFQNSKKPYVNLKPPVAFPTPIKWKEYQLDPLGAAFAASLRGIKHFQCLKKAKKPTVNWKSNIRFLNQNKT